MPPTIEVDDKTLNGFDNLGVSYKVVAPLKQDTDDFIYVPTTGLHVARKTSLHGKNWHESHQNGMQTLSEAIEFLRYCKENHQDVYNEMTQIKSPWRGEWFDAYFEKREDGIYLLTENKSKEEILDPDTLIDDKQISLDSWLENPTSQGLPRKNIQEGNLHYWAPRRDSVAGFDADGGRADLDCGWGPAGGNFDLGVRSRQA